MKERLKDAHYLLFPLLVATENVSNDLGRTGRLGKRLGIGPQNRPFPCRKARTGSMGGMEEENKGKNDTLSRQPSSFGDNTLTISS